jgi:transposase InsO family protein
MPWEVQPVSEIRVAFVHEVRTLHTPVSQACQKFNISRKTGYKWLARYQQQPALPLTDRSRRPIRSPRRTEAALEQAILDVRERFHWGPQKIRAFLRDQGRQLPSDRTVANILKRHGCIAEESPAQPAPLQSFERAQPHELWQCDHKGPYEIAKQKVYTLSVLDDHSRFLVALKPCLDLTMRGAFDILWNAFGEFGLPESILCDNAFSSTHTAPKTVSWFDSQLIRLGIHPTHGRPYHPQTQGKVERFHGTLEQEVLPYIRKDTLPHFTADLDQWRCDVYNPLRPHEALGDKPPLTRFRPSPRPRPSKLPEVVYPPGATLRRVSSAGVIQWTYYRIQTGAGLARQYVRVEDRGHEIAIFYAWKQIRLIPVNALREDTLL